MEVTINHLVMIFISDSSWKLPTYVLSRGDDQRERHQHHYGYAVVQAKDRRIDGDIANFQEAFQPPEHIQHIFSLI